MKQGDSSEIGVFGKYIDPKKVKLNPTTFARTGMGKKVIRTLGECGQNLAASPNEIAISNVIALVFSELQQKPSPEAFMAICLFKFINFVLYPTPIPFPSFVPPSEKRFVA